MLQEQSNASVYRPCLLQVAVDLLEYIAVTSVHSFDEAVTFALHGQRRKGRVRLRNTTQEWEHNNKKLEIFSRCQTQNANTQACTHT